MQNLNVPKLEFRNLELLIFYTLPGLRFSLVHGKVNVDKDDLYKALTLVEKYAKVGLKVREAMIKCASCFIFILICIFVLLCD